MVVPKCESFSSRFLVAIINSSTIRFYWVNRVGDGRKRFPKIKGEYYLARIIYLKQRSKIDPILSDAASRDRKAAVSRKVIDSVAPIAKASLDSSRKVFVQALKDYLSKEGGNEDAALKNSAFATLVDEYAVR